MGQRKRVWSIVGTLLGCGLTLTASCSDPEGKGTPGGAGMATSEAGAAGAEPGSGAAAGESAVGAGGKPSAGGSGNCQAASAPSPTPPAAAALDPDQVARAAAVLGSCVADDGVDRQATGLWVNDLALSVFFYRHATQLECLANAACGCEAVEHCWGWIQRVSDSLCDATCSDGVFHSCGVGESDEPGIETQIDCAALGMECRIDSGCVGSGAEACDPETAPSCEGSTFVGCSSSSQTQLGGPDCATLDLSCGALGCEGTGAACVGTGESEYVVPLVGTGCSGDDLVACVNAKSATIDCATRGPGFTCQNVGTAFFCGLASECAPATAGAPSESDPPSCQGDVLSFCNAGRIEHLDCTALGFSGCGDTGVSPQVGCLP